MEEKRPISSTEGKGAGTFDLEEALGLNTSVAVVDLPVSPPQPVPQPKVLPRPVKAESSKVLRFRKSERIVHWLIAIPFLICWTTALILVVFYNPDPHRPFRDLFSWIHRISAVCLITLPPLAITLRRDFKTHFYNIKQAWLWTLDDIKWLSLMGLAAVSRRVHLPDSGKFNAAEKMNFMMVMTTYPLYILTGLMVWLTDVTFLAWLVHFFMALIATPFLVGHIYMAAINPSSREALNGMITGFVDRQWAKHHHKRWYREQFETHHKRRETDKEPH
ncbi:MAG: cytochrome b/b6 domain-containing protein [Nitrospirae bacterium]|nr:cytochrome b/b6 domain-containing protein [Nitrospirota bacterium]